MKILGTKIMMLGHPVAGTAVKDSIIEARDRSLLTSHQGSNDSGTDGLSAGEFELNTNGEYQ